MRIFINPVILYISYIRGNTLWSGNLRFNIQCKKKFFLQKLVEPLQPNIYLAH